MERVGQWNPPGMPVHSGVTYNDIWGYTASDGTEYGIIGNVDSIVIVKLSDPSNPVREYAYYGGGHAVWRDFKVHNDHLFAVCDGCSEGMHIFDLSALPGGAVSHVMTTTSWFSRAHNIFIDTATQKLYAAGTNTANEGLVVLDVSTPASPSLIGNVIFDQIAGNFYVHDVYVKNDTAYCSHGWTGYYIWDLANAPTETYIDSYDSPGYNHSSWNDTTGTYAYYAEEVPLGRPMAVVDLSNMHDPVNDISVLSTFKDPILSNSTQVTPHNPFVKEDSLIISYYEDGLKVYDLSNPASPDLIAYYDTYPDNSSYTGYDGAWGTYPFLPSGHLLVSDIKYGLNILKVQNCPNPVLYYHDFDGDGFGDPSDTETSCSQPTRYVVNNQDCDDDDDGIYPGAVEICDGLDNDCDGLIDSLDGDVVYNTFYLDSDSDGYGNSAMSIQACSAPEGYVDNDTDCDDSNNMVNPGFQEICDGIDNDCDGLIDNDDNDLGSIEWFPDSDSDGYGINGVTLYQCEQPDGYAAFIDDCDDNDANINPGATEVCDGIDNDCDGNVDESCPSNPCDGVSLNISTITQDEYFAEIDITSDAQTSVNEDISFYAGDHIDLEDGFEVAGGSSFLAAIEDCDNSGNTIDDGVRDYEFFVEQHGEDDGDSEATRYLLKYQDGEKNLLFEHKENLTQFIDAHGLKHQAFKLYIFKNGSLSMLVRP